MFIAIFITGAVCFLLVSSAVTMAIPFSFGRIVDIIYKSDNAEIQSKLVSICVILLPVFIIGAACNFGRIYLINTSGNYNDEYSIFNFEQSKKSLSCLFPFYLEITF